MFSEIILKIFVNIAHPVTADALSSVISSNIDAASSSNDLGSFVNAIVRIAVPAGVLAAIVVFSYAGFMMISSRGNPEKLGEARETVTNAVIGFALIALSVAILLLIRNTLNIPGVTP